LGRSSKLIALSKDLHGVNHFPTLFSELLPVPVGTVPTDQPIGRARATPQGRVKVSVPTVIGRSLIVPALADFADEYPDVDVVLSLEDRIVDIVTEGFDLALRLGDVGDSTLIARRIAAHKFTTCAAPSYIAAYGAPRNPPIWCPIAAFATDFSPQAFLSTGITPVFQSHLP
jgi:DNA-binding transcriptional LysR family regulator